MFTFVAKAIERSLKNIKSAHIFSFWQCNITKEVGNEVTPDYKTLDMCWETVQICFDPPFIIFALKMKLVYTYFIENKM